MQTLLLWLRASGMTPSSVSVGAVRVDFAPVAAGVPKLPGIVNQTDGEARSALYRDIAGPALARMFGESNADSDEEPESTLGGASG